MDEIIAHIEELSKLSPYIKLYRNFDPKIILKHIGKITGEIDRQYVDFLLKTNGASILDYCFLGLKNHNLGMNIYDNMSELWFLDCSLAMRFWGICGTSSGENFGYLDKVDSSGNHYIGYYSTNEPEHVYLVASSFKIFMNKFLQQVESTLTIDKKAIYIDNNDWFLNPQKLIINDIEICLLYTSDAADEYLQSQGTSEYKLYDGKFK